MGFWNKVKDAASDAAGVATGVATGGMYSTNGNGLMQGGGIKGFANNVSLGLLGKDGNTADPNAGMAQNNSAILAQAKQSGLDKQKKFYGSSLNNIGQESTDYVNMLKGNLNQNVAKADQYNQQAGQQRGLDNARAGLSGVDTSALNEQSRRNASFGAAAINEDAQRNALDLYGQSISNRITGANTMDTQEKALGIASLQQPVAQAGQGGILSSIFGGLF